MIGPFALHTAMNDSTATYIVHTTVNSKEAAADLVREAILSGHPHTTITARPAGLSERRLHSDELGEILDLVAQARERAGAPPFVLELTPGQRALVLQALRDAAEYAATSDLAGELHSDLDALINELAE